MRHQPQEEGRSEQGSQHADRECPAKWSAADREVRGKEQDGPEQS
jgi:hypothetical protein